MGTYNPNGRKASDEGRPTWRPQDQSHPNDYRGRGNDLRDSNPIHDERWSDRDVPDEGGRDPSRWEGSRGSELGHHERTERYGQGQSGYSAGRYGEDRAQQNQMRNRNDFGTSSSYSRDRDFGGDDRFTGRGNEGRDPWRDDRSVSGMGGSTGFGGGGGYDQSTGFDQRMGYDRYGHAGGERMGYERQANPWSPAEEPRSSYGMRGSQDGQGYRGSQQHSLSATGPHRGKGPAGYQRSDERVRELVSEALAHDDMIDASQIHVTVKDGEVTLTGTVDDRRTKREAEDCVSSVAGVRDVQIQLKVKDERQPKVAQSTAGSGSANREQPDDDKKVRA